MPSDFPTVTVLDAEPKMRKALRRLIESALMKAIRAAIAPHQP